MADLFDRFGVKGEAGAVMPKPDLFDRFAPPGGGVQDWEPSQQPAERSLGADAADWMKTRVIKAATSFAGTGRGIADIARLTAEKLGIDPKVAQAMLTSNPVTAVGQFMPGTADMNRAVFDGMGVRQKNLSGPIGKAVDVGVETVLQAPAFPGSFVRNAIPAFVGGAAQELAGQAAEGTPYEIPARLLTGLVAGGAAAAGQNVVGNVAQGTTNALFANARNTESQAARILGRALEADGTTMPALSAQHKQFPAGTPLAVVGGENVKGAARGSIAAPGPARTTVENALTQYAAGAEDRVGSAINANVSNLPPVSTRVSAIADARSKAAGPAYEAAGIPRNRADLPNADRLMLSDDVLTLFKDSPDVQAALRNARRVPELKDQPINSMAVLDRVYKQVGGLEQEAARAGNNVRAADIGDIRKRLAAAIGEENPAYTKALETYSDPSKLIDAANMGKTMFSQRIDAAEIGRNYRALPADQKVEFLGGVADYLRTKAGNTDRATAGERIAASANERARLQAVLPEADYKALTSLLNQEKQGARAARDISKGSRTTPMMLEAGENAGVDGNMLMRFLRGDRLGAIMDAAGSFGGRLTEGRTKEVNALLSQWLMETDPAKVGLVNALANRAQIAAAATQAGRRNALFTGAALGASGADR